MSRVSGRVFGIPILLGLLFAGKVCSQSMRLQDTPLGSVVQIGSFNYIKITENKYMQSTQVTCPDGATVGGKYVKCFASKTKYEEQCGGGGSYYCKFEEAETVDGYQAYNYTCSLPCYTPDATFNSDTEKCECDTSYYVYRQSPSSNAYMCAPIYDFDYTGDVQTFTAPVDGTYKLEVWGAQGAAPSGSNLGGYGGYSIGNIKLASNQVLKVVVGNTGTNTAGGYNGGGNGGGNANGWSGGGATHIALSGSSYTTIASYGDTTTGSQYILVVGGGGGGKNTSNQGGHGGGANATAGTNGNATQTTGYAFGQGNKGGNVNSGGGGGGWYGGYSGSTSTQKSGGGSGYLNTSKLISYTYRMYCYSGCSGDNTTAVTIIGHAEANKANTGNGYARITLISVD